MSSTDNTRNKLLDSMRMSKSSAAETPGTESVVAAEETPAPAQAPAKAAAAIRPAAKKKVAPKKKAAAAQTPASEKKAVGQDPYQGARRIWPD